MQLLPGLITKKIVKYLDIESILEMRLVCKKFKRAIYMFCDKLFVRYDLHNIDEIEGITMGKSISIAFEVNIISKLKNIRRMKLKYQCAYDSNIFDIFVKYESVTYWMKELDLSFCQNVTNNSLQYFSKLKKLNLSYCRWVTDKSLCELGNIKHLILVSCKNISNVGLMYLNNARKLNIYGCEKISDEGLKYLKNLKYLNIGFCGNITKKGINYVKNVIKLEIKSCHRIDIEIGRAHV